jgi:hypothetical protein
LNLNLKQITKEIESKEYARAAENAVSWRESLLQRAREGEEDKLTRATLSLLEEAQAAPAPCEPESDAGNMAFGLAAAALSPGDICGYLTGILNGDNEAVRWLCGSEPHDAAVVLDAAAGPAASTEADGRDAKAARQAGAVLLGAALRCAGSPPLSLSEAECWAGCARLLGAGHAASASLLLARALQRALLRSDVARLRRWLGGVMSLSAGVEGEGRLSQVSQVDEVAITVEAATAALNLDLPALARALRVVRVYSAQLPAQSDLVSAVRVASEDASRSPG